MPARVGAARRRRARARARGEVGEGFRRRARGRLAEVLDDGGAEAGLAAAGDGRAVDAVDGLPDVGEQGAERRGDGDGLAVEPDDARVREGLRSDDA